MRRIIIIFFLLLAGLFNFAYSQNKINRTDYAEKINQLVYHLSCDSNDPQAAKKLIKTYSSALREYQHEMVRLQSVADSFKWTNTYELMNKLNGLSNEILFNSTASLIVCEPKVYTDELLEVKQKAVPELYEAGIKSLRNGSKLKAKEAYSYFVKVEQLSPNFKDVSQKIQEARHKATLNVVIEKMATQRFYQNFLNQLQSEFRYDKCVNIYSYKEAKQRKIGPVDWYVRISFINFENKVATFYQGSYFIDINIVAEIKIFSTIENKDILSTRIPWQYVWTSSEPGECDVQGLFYSLSLSINDYVYDVVSRFMGQYKY